MQYNSVLVGYSHSAKLHNIIYSYTTDYETITDLVLNTRIAKLTKLRNEILIPCFK